MDLYRQRKALGYVRKVKGAVRPLFLSLPSLKETLNRHVCQMAGEASPVTLCKISTDAGLRQAGALHDIHDGGGPLLAQLCKLANAGVFAVLIELVSVVAGECDEILFESNGRHTEILSGGVIDVCGRQGVNPMGDAVQATI